MSGDGNGIGRRERGRETGTGSGDGGETGTGSRRERERETGTVSGDGNGVGNAGTGSETAPWLVLPRAAPCTRLSGRRATVYRGLSHEGRLAVSYLSFHLDLKFEVRMVHNFV